MTSGKGKGRVQTLAQIKAGAWRVACAVVVPFGWRAHEEQAARLKLKGFIRELGACAEILNGYLGEEMNDEQMESLQWLNNKLAYHLAYVERTLTSSNNLDLRRTRHSIEQIEFYVREVFDLERDNEVGTAKLC